MAYAIFSPIDAATVEKKTDNTKPLGSPIRTVYGASSVYGVPATYAEPLLDFDIWGRAAFLFDCRSLKTTATSLSATLIIQKVEFYRVFSSAPFNADFFEFDFYLGSYGSPSFTLNQALYNFGSFCATQTGEAFPSAEFIDLGSTGIAALSLTSYTALRVANPFNDSHPSAGLNEDGEAVFDPTSALRVTYEMIGPARRRFSGSARRYSFSSAVRKFIFEARNRVFTFTASSRPEIKSEERRLTFNAKNRSKAL